MNRRGFLRSLLLGTAGLVAGAELDLDKLLWVPGAKTFFLPPPVETFQTFDLVADVRANRPNRLVTSDWVMVESLRILNQNLMFADHVACMGGTINGDTVTVRIPARYA